MICEELKSALNLKNEPDMVMFGAVKKREYKVAALRGVLVDMRYVLEFFDPETKESVSIDVEVYEGVSTLPSTIPQSSDISQQRRLRQLLTVTKPSEQIKFYL